MISLLPPAVWTALHVCMVLVAVVCSILASVMAMPGLFWTSALFFGAGFVMGLVAFLAE